MGKKSMLDMNTKSLQLVHISTMKSIKIEVFSLSRVYHEISPFGEVNDTNDFEEIGWNYWWKSK